jgi:hypothetical protein
MNPIKIFSWAFVTVATIGFGWLTYYDWNTTKAARHLAELQVSSDLEIREIQKAVDAHDGAIQFRNHVQLLQLLKANPNFIKREEQEITKRLKAAVILANRTGGQKELEKQIEKLRFYQELYPIFRKQLDASLVKLNQIGSDIGSTKQKISNMDGTKSRWFLFFLALNSIGLLLGFFSQKSDRNPQTTHSANVPTKR